MNKLTAKLIEKAQSKIKEYKLADGGGLYLRVRPTGGKSWLFLFRLPKVRLLQKMTIGSVADFSLKAARNKLIELRKQINDGFDPRKVRAAARVENSEAITMQTLFNAWIDFSKFNNNFSKDWNKKHENRWDRHLKDVLGMILVKDISRAHFARALDLMSKKGIKEETRKALTTLNLMMDYALTRNFIDQNPARILRPKDFAATSNRPKKRALTLEELRQLWLVLDQSLLTKNGIAITATMMLTTVIAIKLLILTGARRGEVASMRWSELDLGNNIWQLNASRTKNRQSHTIYLSDLAVDLIKNLQPLTSNSVFVFDTGKGSIGHINNDSLTRAISRLRSKTRNNILADLKSFTIHDLRRSAATGWGEYLKTPPHVIERMLNHQPLNKLVATYQQAIYAEEQKNAWQEWGKMIQNQVIKESHSSCK